MVDDKRYPTANSKNVDIMSARRKSILQPSNPQRVVSYTFSLKTKTFEVDVFTFDISATLHPRVEAFRPRRMIASVSKRNLIQIDELIISGQNQLAQSIDAYKYSMRKHDDVIQERLRELGIVSIEEFDALQDAGLNIHLPDPLQIDFPTVTQNSTVRMVGKWLSSAAEPQPFILTFIGQALENTVSK